MWPEIVRSAQWLRLVTYAWNLEESEILKIFYAGDSSLEVFGPRNARL